MQAVTAAVVNLPLEQLHEQAAEATCELQEYKMHNADVLFKEDSTVDDLIDVIEVGSQVGVRLLGLNCFAAHSSSTCVAAACTCLIPFDVIACDDTCWCQMCISYWLGFVSARIQDLRTLHWSAVLNMPSLQGNRRYVKCLYVFNKIDVCSMEEVDAIARQPDSIPLSCTQRLNLDTLLEMLWDMMGLVSSPADPASVAKPLVHGPWRPTGHQLGFSPLKDLARAAHRVLSSGKAASDSMTVSRCLGTQNARSVLYRCSQ